MGFEPTVGLDTLRRFSKPLPSATRPPLRLFDFFLVPGVGVEPTHLAVSDFESDASANFAIRANQKGKPMKKNFPIFYKNKF